MIGLLKKPMKRKGFGAALKGIMANKMKSTSKVSPSNVAASRYKVAVPKQRSGKFMQKLEGKLKNKVF